MMLVLTVSGFLFLPILGDYYLQYQSRLLRDEIIDLIVLAEQKALAQRRNLGVCFNGDAERCDQYGYNNLLIFIDKFNNGQIYSQEQILFKKQIHARHLHIRWQFFPYYRDYLKIRPDVMNMTDNGSVWVGVGRYSWRILVNKTGNVHFVAS